MLKLEFRALVFHCRIVATPVNRPPPASAAPAGADARLYLRDQDLNDGAALIRAASRRLSQLVYKASASSGVVEAEIDVMEEIFDTGPMDVTELRDRLNAPKQSMARTLNQLETRGLTTRDVDPRDRRRRLVTLTPAGLAFVQAATERRREALRQIFLQSGPEAVNGARRVLKELLRVRSDT
jgi:DNA-binding MarR family transcriptional regulator